MRSDRVQTPRDEGTPPVVTRHKMVSNFLPDDHSVVLDEYKVGQHPVHKIAAWVPVSREFLDDYNTMPEYIEQAIVEGMERNLYPWRFFDRRVLPVFDLFPRWSRLEAWWRRHW